MADDKDEARKKSRTGNERGIWAVELLGRMLEEETFADIELSSKEGTLVKAHRCVLDQAGPVFRQAVQQNNTIDTSLWAEAAIRQVLQFVYLKQIDLSLETVIDVAEMAQHFGLEQLQIESLLLIRGGVASFNPSPGLIDSHAKLESLSPELDKQNRAKPRTYFWNILSEKKIKWPIYDFNSEQTQLISSDLNAIEVPSRETMDCVSATISGSCIYLCATEINRTHLYSAQLRQQEKICWVKHREIASRKLNCPLVVHSMLYAYGDENHCCRLNFRSLSDEWRYAALKDAGTMFQPFQVMHLPDTEEQVICASFQYKEEAKSLQIKIFAWTNSSPEPRLISETLFQVKCWFAEQALFVIAEKLYLVFDETVDKLCQLYVFDGQTEEFTQFEMVTWTEPFPNVYPHNFTLIQASEQDGVIFLMHKYDKIRDPGEIWKFCLDTRVWMPVDNTHIERRQMIFPEWQAYALCL